MKDRNNEELRIGQQVVVMGRREWYLGSIHSIPPKEDPIQWPNIIRDADGLEFAVDPSYVIGLEYSFVGMESAMVHLILQKKLFSLYLNR